MTHDIGNIEKKNELLADFITHISFCDSKTYRILNNVQANPQQNVFADNLETDEIAISLVIICKNEERCIGRCLDAIAKNKRAKDEVLLIDSGSTDKTLEIVNNYRFVKVLYVKWNDDFSEIRNKGILDSKNEWIFFIDADESIEKNSLERLRKYIKVITTLGIKDMVCSPKILDTNGYEYRGVKRILNKKSGIKFYGRVHEEPRKMKSALGTDIQTISFDDIVLHHDGYKKEIIVQKDKIKRNIKLLEKMLEEEPDHPRWKYFYCRDGEKTLSVKKYENNLIKAIELSTDESQFYYKIRALSDLIRFYCVHNDLGRAKDCLNILQNSCPDLSDVVFWNTEIALFQMKDTTRMLLDTIIKYQQEHREIEYGSIHPLYYHLDYLCAVCFFEIGEYSQCFSILKKLESVGYENYRNKLTILKSELDIYFNVGDNGKSLSINI